MADQENTYFQQEILHRPLQKHGLLEEFNLPPKVIAFIRTRRLLIILSLAGLAVAILGWSAFGHYADKRNDRAATALAEIVAEADTAKRQTRLEQFLKEYPRTGPAVWARVELGHLAFDTGNFDAAISQYRQVLDSRAGKGPIFPLVQLNLAQAYENKGDLKQALVAYQKLAEVKSFTVEATLAMAGIQVRQKAIPEAKKLYAKALAMEGISPAVKEMVQVRMDRL